jgi:hypothetical protein
MLNNTTHFDAAMKIDEINPVGKDRELIRLGWIIRGNEVEALEEKIALYESVIRTQYDQ